ncbi:MAG: alpha/beta fold hydrolase [Acidimicrobiales bacterium]
MAATARVGEIELHYERFGEADDPLLVLVAGLNTQAISWPLPFCAALADHGLSVVRFDNRDVGLSTHLDDSGFGRRDVDAMIVGEPHAPVPYTLSDMAADVAGLISHLSADPVHLFGTSLGGMIAQSVAIEHPGVVASLASLSSSTGEPEVGQPTPEALAAIMEPAPEGREASIERGIAVREVWSSPGHHDPEALRDYFDECWDRRPADADADARQAAAYLVSPPRDAGLRGIGVPTVVLHGDRDTLVGPSGGERTAALIPGARHVVLEGMGHDMPEAYWPTIIDAVVANIEHARVAAPGPR